MPLRQLKKRQKILLFQMKTSQLKQRLLQKNHQKNPQKLHLIHRPRRPRNHVPQNRRRHLLLRPSRLHRHQHLKLQR